MSILEITFETLTLEPLTYTPLRDPKSFIKNLSFDNFLIEACFLLILASLILKSLKESLPIVIEFLFLNNSRIFF